MTGLPPIHGITAYGLAGLAVDVRGGLWAWGSGLALDGGPPPARCASVSPRRPWTSRAAT
ncbi:hypothetical protein [Streptomyces sp. MNU103]|uniref:hypothetical protein n=1 Tax=Streptomyces sp. MNU103 TaxID=2560024 RepID=UPI001E2C0814|nr:hypothetical protein [Streptomyces sp. MNU103]